MIKYGYFRHRFDAHQNAKLNRLADEIGIEAFAYYYTLLELYGAAISKKEDQSSAQIHIRVIANTWRKRVDSCKKVLTKLQLSDLLVVTLCDSTCHISIHNYLKYYGSYQKTDIQKTSNKIKRNKIKINNNKTALFDFEILYQIYPRKQGKTKGMEKCIKEITTEQLYSDLKKAIENYGKICASQNTEKKYIKQFSTFMNCWRDYLENEEVPMSIKEIFDECLND